MTTVKRWIAVLALSTGAIACSTDDGVVPPPPVGGIQFINGFDGAVEMLVDGVARATLSGSGDLATLALDAGNRVVTARSGAIATGALQVRVTGTRLIAVAAVRGNGGALQARTLDDTNGVVPSGATKLRVLHLAPRAGEVQVWRTQPDYQTPIRWAFPFTYNAVDTYYQSTPGAWEVRIWTDTITYPPGNGAGWGAALDAARVTLGSGEKKTVVILDKPGGGVKLIVID